MCMEMSLASTSQQVAHLYLLPVMAAMRSARYSRSSIARGSCKTSATTFHVDWDVVGGLDTLLHHALECGSVVELSMSCVIM